MHHSPTMILQLTALMSLQMATRHQRERIAAGDEPGVAAQTRAATWQADGEDLPLQTVTIVARFTRHLLTSLASVAVGKSTN